MRRMIAVVMVLAMLDSGTWVKKAHPSTYDLEWDYVLENGSVCGEVVKDIQSVSFIAKVHGGSRGAFTTLAEAQSAVEKECAK